MIFLFDFGDNWQFSVLLEGINPPDKELTIPMIEECWARLQCNTKIGMSMSIKHNLNKSKQWGII